MCLKRGDGVECLRPSQAETPLLARCCICSYKSRPCLYGGILSINIVRIVVSWVVFVCEEEYNAVMCL